MGRAMERVVAVARECGYLDGVPPFLGPDRFDRLPRDQTLALATGSQGEPRAALARIAEDEHPTATLAAGDVVIFSSRTIPGNEKAVGGIVNGARRAGRRGHHRPQPSRPCLGPSAARRNGEAVQLAAAEDRRAGAWRAAASDRTRRLRPRAGRRRGRARLQRRRGAARRRRGARSSGGSTTAG